MATTRTYSQLKKSFAALSGIGRLETTDEEFFLQSLNRSAFKAWSASEIWPRYMVQSEERCVVPYSTYNIVPYVETNKDTIGEFHRIYTADPWANASSATEVEFIVDLSNGARIINPAQTYDSVWVDYKKEWDGPYDEDSTAIPEEFADFIIHQALSDFYTGDGQTDNAVMAERRAESYLQQQLGRLSYTNRNPYKYGSIMTHTNHQHRY